MRGEAREQDSQRAIKFGQCLSKYISMEAR